MAQLIDEVTDKIEPQSVEELTYEEQPVETPDEEIPEKYKGKSLKEIVQMHQEAEKALGRQGGEVGELRKLVDQYILAQSAPPSAAEKEEEVDWFADPDKALEARLNSHPKIKELEQERLRNKQQSSVAQLQAKHPDYKDILNSSEFADWIKASKVRTKLFVQADQGYDTDAADELFSTWKERKQLAEQTVRSDETLRKADIKRASTGNARGSSNPQPRKIYRRADIIDLMTKDPQRYQALAADIYQAYAEGRVK